MIPGGSRIHAFSLNFKALLCCTALATRASLLIFIMRINRGRRAIRSREL